MSSTEYKSQLSHLIQRFERERSNSAKNSSKSSNKFSNSPKKLPLKSNLKIRNDDAPSSNRDKVTVSNVSSKQSKKVTIITEPVKSKSKTKDDKIQELPSDSEDEYDDDDEYNDSFTQSKKTEKTEKTYNT